MKKNLNIRGFTLVELLVAITIVAILSTIGLATYRESINQARLANTQSEMRQLRIMMEDYRSRYGQLPSQDSLLDDLEDASILSGVDKTKYETDEWDQPFQYINNDKVSGKTFSLFWTTGPNETTNRDQTIYYEGKNCGTTDDWCLDLPYGE